MCKYVFCPNRSGMTEKRDVSGTSTFFRPVEQRRREEAAIREQLAQEPGDPETEGPMEFEVQLIGPCGTSGIGTQYGTPGRAFGSVGLPIHVTHRPRYSGPHKHSVGADHSFVHLFFWEGSSIVLFKDCRAGLRVPDRRNSEDCGEV